MVTAALFVYAALAVLGAVIMLVSARRAPVGFEDENGFHLVSGRSEPERVLVLSTVTAN